MDIFIEKIVKKRLSGADVAVNILIVFAALILFFIIFLFGFQFLGMLAILIGFGELYGAYWLLSTRNVEFEYSLTNGDLDVDKIIAQRRRKRLVNINCREFELVAPVNEVHKREMDTPSIKTKIYAVSYPSAEGQYFAIFTHKTLGKTLLVFEPDERMIESFKSYIPRKVSDQ